MELLKISKPPLIACLALPLLLAPAFIPFDAGGLGIIAAAVLLATGAGFVWWTQDMPSPESSRLLLLAAAAIALAWTVTGFFFAGPVFLRALAAASCFVLPSLLKSAWKSFLPIFEQQLKLWQSKGILPMEKAVIFLNSLPVEIRMMRSFAGGMIGKAPLIAPANMELGEVFAHFLEDAEQVQRTALPPGKLAWSFHTARVGRLPRYLDPTLSLLENKVPANSVITATAIEVTPLLSASLTT